MEMNQQELSKFKERMGTEVTFAQSENPEKSEVI